MSNAFLNNSESKVWYKEPYVWLLVLFPLAAVAMGGVMIWLAVNSDDGLVVDDYYKKGLEINMDLARDRAAEYYGIDADLVVDEKGKKMIVNLYSNEKLTLPEKIHARFIHRTRSGFDQSITLTGIPDGSYQADMPDLVSGNWHMLIEAGDWRLFKQYSVK